MSRPLDYWKIGTHFLRLAEAACGELVKGENADIVISNRPITPSEYNERTKWSDHSIGVSVLFCFFHGMEVILKGFISIQDTVPKHHRLTELLANFEQRYPGANVGKIIANWTRDLDPASPLGRFLAQNHISIDDWFQALKYPELMTGNSIDHFSLMFGGCETVAFWQSVGQAAASLLMESVALARSLGRA
jgi:hypothetical protein